MIAIENLPLVYRNRCPAPFAASASPSSSASQQGTLPSPVGSALTVKPIVALPTGSFGAEVQGIDWTVSPLPDSLVAELIQLQNKYAVLIFRNTGLDNARHIAFSRQLGDKLEVNPFYSGIENDRLQEPLLFDVGNMDKDGNLIAKDSRRWHHALGNVLWHTDSSYHSPRSKYSLLLSHGHVAPGGFTHFADTRQAYEDLSESMKMELEPLVVVHDLWWSRKLGSPEVYKEPTESEKAKKPPSFHKLVQTGPDGRKTLYLAAHAKLILGRSLEDSQRLIWDLIEHCTQPKYVFSMEWVQGGDMVWWDNRQSMHRANPYKEGMSKRDVRRSTVIDDGPLANGFSSEQVDFPAGG